MSADLLNPSTWVVGRIVDLQRLDFLRFPSRQVTEVILTLW
jgi:hypothetical protein